MQNVDRFSAPRSFAAGLGRMCRARFAAPRQALSGASKFSVKGFEAENFYIKISMG
jgi:hypothetical protein